MPFTTINIRTLKLYAAVGLWWYTSYCFSVDIKAWFAVRKDITDALVLCTALFGSGFIALSLVSLPERGDVFYTFHRFQTKPYHIMAATILGCIANMFTTYLYVSTAVHSIQYLRCASPLLAAGVSIITKESAPSWGLFSSLVCIVLGVGLAVWKDQQITWFSIVLGSTVNVIVVLRNAAVRTLLAASSPHEKRVGSTLLLGLSNACGLMISLICLALGPSRWQENTALLFDISTFKVAFFSLAYNLFSYLTLCDVGLIAHSVLEQGKRFFIIVVFCIATTQCPPTSSTFWIGVFLISVGAFLFMHSKGPIRGASQHPPVTSDWSIYKFGKRSCSSHLSLVVLVLTLLCSNISNDAQIDIEQSLYSQNNGSMQAEVLVVLVGPWINSTLKTSLAFHHLIDPWKADTAAIGYAEDIHGNPVLRGATFKWEVPDEYEWPDILSYAQSDVDGSWKEQFCRFQNGSNYEKDKCIPDYVGTFLAHQVMAKEHIIELKMNGHAYEWYAITQLDGSVLQLCRMYPLSSFSKDVIHVAYGHEDGPLQTAFLSLIPSTKVEEGLNHTAYFATDLHMAATPGIGKLQEKMFKRQCIPHRLFPFPGYSGAIPQNIIDLPEYQRHILGIEREYRACPGTNVETELKQAIDSVVALASTPSASTQRCTDVRRNLVSRCNKSTDNTLFFLDWRGSNFGDELSPRITQSISSLNNFKQIDRALSSLNGTVLTSLGSILHDVVRHLGSVKVLHIWGSGSHEKLCKIQPLNNAPEIHIHAVRGPLTAACLTSALTNANVTSSDFVYGDPGLLVPSIYPHCKKRAIPTCEVCIIPHKSDERDLKDAIQYRRLQLLGCAKTTAESPETMIDWIVGCGKMISSSLHGIVIAEAFGIPSIWLQPPGSRNSEGQFKYLDYYLATGRSIVTPSTNLQDAIQRSPTDFSGYRFNTTSLIESFPYETWGGCRPLLGSV